MWMRHNFRDGSSETTLIPMPTPDAETLQDHIAGTYFDLRLGVGIVAAVLPIALWGIGRVRADESLRCSMSVYYYSLSQHPAARDWLVGTLCAVGVFLYLYRGFTKPENWALNVAGLLAVAIALVPTTPGCAKGAPPTAHTVFAIIFFLAIAYVSVFRAEDTLSLVRDTDKAKRLRTWYRILGAVMATSPFVAVALDRWTRGNPTERHATFFIEAIAVWTFAAYWITKSIELRATDADLLAAQGALAPVPPPIDGHDRAPGRFVQTALPTKHERGNLGPSSPESPRSHSTTASSDLR